MASFWEYVDFRSVAAFGGMWGLLGVNQAPIDEMVLRQVGAAGSVRGLEGSGASGAFGGVPKRDCSTSEKGFRVGFNWRVLLAWSTWMVRGSEGCWVVEVAWAVASGAVTGGCWS